jgi:hypothetical protein
MAPSGGRSREAGYTEQSGCHAAARNDARKSAEIRGALRVDGRRAARTVNDASLAGRISAAA